MKFRNVEVDDEHIAKMDMLLELYATAAPEMKVLVRNGIVTLMFIVASDAKIQVYEEALKPHRMARWVKSLLRKRDNG